MVRELLVPWFVSKPRDMTPLVVVVIKIGYAVCDMLQSGYMPKT